MESAFTSGRRPGLILYDSIDVDCVEVPLRTFSDLEAAQQDRYHGQPSLSAVDVANRTYVEPVSLNREVKTVKQSACNRTAVVAICVLLAIIASTTMVILILGLTPTSKSSTTCKGCDGTNLSSEGVGANTTSGNTDGQAESSATTLSAVTATTTTTTEQALMLDCTSVQSRQQFSDSIRQRGTSPPATATTTATVVAAQLIVSASQTCPEADVITHVHGDVVITTTVENKQKQTRDAGHSPTGVNIVLPQLISIGGSLIVDEDADSDNVISQLSAPVLTYVGGDLTVGHRNMTTLSLSALETVGGSLVVSCHQLHELTLERVTSIGGDLVLDVADDAAVSAAMLTSVNGDVRVSSPLQHVGSVIMPQLESIRGDLCLQEVVEPVRMAAVLSDGTVLSESGWCVKGGTLTCDSGMQVAATLTLSGTAIRLGSMVTAIECDAVNVRATSFDVGAVKTVTVTSGLTLTGLSSITRAPSDEIVVLEVVGDVEMISVNASTVFLSTSMLIDGDLSLDAVDLVSDGIDGSCSVTGDVAIALSPYRNDRVNFGALDRVGGRVEITGMEVDEHGILALSHLDFGRLSHVGGGSLELNALISLDLVYGMLSTGHGCGTNGNTLDKLRHHSSGNIMTCTGFSSLKTLSFGTGIYVVRDDLVLNGNIEHVDFGTLTSIGGFLAVLDTFNLSQFDLGKLSGFRYGVLIARNEALTRVTWHPDRDIAGARYFAVVDNPELMGVSVSRLVRATYLYVDSNDALQTLAVPDLKEVTAVSETDRLPLAGAFDLASHVIISNQKSLEALDLGSLETCSNLDLYVCRSLKSLELPKLRTVEEGMHLWQVDSLETLNLGSLEQRPKVALQDYPKLSAVNLSSLHTVEGDLTMESLDALESVDLSSLHTVEGDLTMESLASLVSVDLSSLTTVADLWVSEVSLSQGLSLPQLQSLSDLRVQYTNAPWIDLPVLAVVPQAPTLVCNLDLTRLSAPKLSYTGTLHLGRQQLQLELNRANSQLDLPSFQGDVTVCRTHTNTMSVTLAPGGRLVPRRCYMETCQT